MRIPSVKYSFIYASNLIPGWEQVSFLGSADNFYSRKIVSPYARPVIQSERPLEYRIWCKPELYLIGFGNLRVEQEQLFLFLY